MAPANKANYKTFEAQARMVRAIVAAHPEVKWNYKEIAACYGSDMTDHALNHRFRRLRAQSIIVREGRQQGFDMKNLTIGDDLPITQEAVDKNNIAKYFGQSTADGIQFQFRSIKKDADTLRQVEQDGGDVANCLSFGGGGTSSVTATPSKPTPLRRGLGSRSGTARKRTRTIPEIKRTSSDEDDDDDKDTDDWSEREQTPSKRPKIGAFSGQKSGTPIRRAAAKANVTIAEASAQLDTSDSQPEVETPTAITAFTTDSAVPQSIFGNAHQNPNVGRNAQSIFADIEKKPTIDRKASVGGSFHSTMFGRNHSDAYIASGLAEDPYMPMNGSGNAFEGDGEI